MGGGSVIDTTFDVRTDAGGGDPDRYSGTLRRYHQLLWSKPLPNGQLFDLDPRLRHQSTLGTFQLSSDGIVHTYTRWSRPARLAHVVGQIPAEEQVAFYDLACTVGAFLVFPVKHPVDGIRRQSINQRRGTHHQIRDRFDLTLECIRRQYTGAASPLSDTLDLHGDFFALFDDFRGYVEHFLLQDLVTDDFTSVRFMKDFADFSNDPLPAGSPDEYREYMNRWMTFIRDRNTRIATYAAAHLA